MTKKITSNEKTSINGQHGHREQIHQTSVNFFLDEALGKRAWEHRSAFHFLFSISPFYLFQVWFVGKVVIWGIESRVEIQDQTVEMLRLTVERSFQEWREWVVLL